MMFVATLVLLAAPQTLERHGCAQCHVEVQTATSRKTCAGCHRDLSQGAMEHERDRFEPAVWQRFKTRTAKHFVNVPSLSTVSRLRASWVTAFLAAPHDVRPRLSESMIRNRLTAAEREELAKHFGAQADEAPPKPPSAARLSEGRRRFEALGCGACHLGAPEHVTRAQALAPDLSLARHRMNFTTLVRYLLEPSPEMTVRARDENEARLLAEWLYFGEVPRPTLADRGPAPHDPAAPVPTYEEVEARVFKAVCWHCHSNPDKAGGDGGPGMTGGFGYPARGLSFASFEEVMAGSRDDAGRSQSIFRKGKTQEPVLLEVLRARYVEERGPVAADAPLGMPLGLPALSPDDFALVERWVKGGRRPPRSKSAPAASPMGLLETPAPR